MTARHIPARLLSDIVSLARDVNQILREDAKPNDVLVMSRYTTGYCKVAAVMMTDYLFVVGPREFEVRISPQLIRGINVPGCLGQDRFHGWEKLHYLALLELDREAIAIDTTAAQLKGRNRKFKDTEVLMIISTPAEILKAIKSIYGGGNWEKVPLNSMPFDSTHNKS